jgi:hypothetical protein
MSMSMAPSFPEQPESRPVSLAPPGALRAPLALPLSRRATEPVKRRPYPVVAIVAAWATAICAIALVCLFI